MDSGLRSLALCALGALAAGVAISWAVSVWRPRRGGLAAAVCALVALNLPPLGRLLSPLHYLVIGLPLVLLSTASRFEAINRDYGNAARSLGASEARIFLRLILPLAWRSLLLASILVLLCLMGERLL